MPGKSLVKLRVRSLDGQRHFAAASVSQVVCSSAFRRFVSAIARTRLKGLKAELQTEVALSNYSRQYRL